MLLTDSHCHFDFAAFEPERTAHWQRTKAAGVHRLVIPGIEAKQWPALPALCATHCDLYYAVGLHPWWVATAPDNWQTQLIAALDQAKNNPHCVAIGECGLDSKLPVPLAQQEAVLVTHLRLAIEYQKPVILHSYRTHDRILKWLRRYPVVGGVLHGFSGSQQQAEAFWQRGIHLGVGGSITYPRANKTRQAVAALPINALVLETDAPDMPLCGFQGQDNHPTQLPRVLTALAQLRQQNETILAKQLEANVNRLFGW